jgi:hypothetical protein
LDRIATTCGCGACGPGHVIRNTNYTYGVAVKNFGKRSFRKLQLIRVNIVLPFKQHSDPKGSNFTVDVRGYGPSERGGLTKDFIFIKK